MKFSLVIPVAPYRDAEIIESIKRLDYPRGEFQVIVVKGKNPSENRNKGFDKSLGDFIVFLDDDAVIEKDYLKQIADFFENHPEIDIVGGPQLTPKDDKGFAKISGYALESKFGAYKVSKRYSCKEEDYDVDETCLTSANLICKRKVLEKIKFDPSLFPGEDPKFISDAKKQGFMIAYFPKIVIYHRRRSTPKELAKQIFNYGKVRPKKEKFAETIKMPFFLIPSLFAIYLLFLGISLLLNPVLTGGIIGVKTQYNFILLLPLFIYLFLAILFSFVDSIKNKNLKAIFILPFIYPIIHLSYGIGMIWGYFRKLKK